MKRKVIYLLMFFSSAIFSQKNTNIWYFGNSGAGINFNTCPPTALTNGWNDPVNSLFEGSTAISDANGNLLFYSNGKSVFNSNHQLMPNGADIGGGNTQTQNIIIQKPGSYSLFYIFIPQIQASGGSGIVRYSIIDMSLNTGLGDVISSNVILRDTVGRRGTEKLTATKHANGTDIWLIGHDYYNNKFFCYLITSAGVNPIPVETSVGPAITDPVNQSHFPSMGEMKASPDGSKLGFTCNGNGLTALFQFNNLNGVISDPITLDINDGGVNCLGYGVTFSPDNSKFYVNSAVQVPNPPPIYLMELFQFDLANWNQASIQNSRYTVIAGPIVTYYYSMKLGPDKKIYMSKGVNTNFLSVINSPNASGLACNYVDQGFNLGVPGSWGLNNVMEMFDTIPNPVSLTASSPSICQGSTVSLYASGSTTYSWLPTNNFPGSNSSSITVSPTITTTYSVNNSNTNPGCMANTSFQVLVNPLPVFSISSSNIPICSGSTVSLYANGNANYFWLPVNNFPGSNSPSITVTPTITTTYSVNATNINCTAGAIFSVLVNSLPVVTLSADQTTICSGSESIILNADGAVSYTWENSQTGTSISVSPSISTIYSVTGLGQNNCINTSTIQITVNSCTGISEIEFEDASFVIYPNPNNGQFVLRSGSEKQLNIFNVMGENIIEINAIAGSIYIDVSEKLCTGIYFVKGSKENSQLIQKMIVNK